MALLSDRDPPLMLQSAIERRRMKVAANAVIHFHALVSVRGGYLKPAADAADETCVGIAEEAVDNTGGNDGDAEVYVIMGGARVPSRGPDKIEQTDVGRYAVVTDDEGVQRDGTASANVRAGKVLAVESGDWVLVHFNQALV